MDNSTLTVVREEVDPCRIKLNVEVAAAEVSKISDTITEEFHRQGKVPGFRPGKSPRKLIQRVYAKQIREEAKNRLLREAVQQAIEMESLTPETRPQVENEDELQVSDSASFVFAVSFEIAPQFELPDYKQLVLTEQGAAVDDNRVEQEIADFLQSRASFVKVERPAAPGDLLRANYHGTVQDLDDDQELPASANYILDATNSWLNLREPEVLPGCTAALSGAQDGDKRNFTVDFPESYFEKSLAGKSAAFEVEVLEVHATEVPELTDEFAREQLGTESAAEVKERVREQLEVAEKNQQQQALRQQLLDKLMGDLEFPLPQALLAHETYQAFSRLYQREAQRTRQPEQLDQDKLAQDARSMAKDRLRRRYVLGRIAEQEDITVSPEEFEQTLDMMAAAHKMTAKAVRKRLADNGAIMELYEDMRENKTIEFLLANASIAPGAVGKEQEEEQ